MDIAGRHGSIIIERGREVTVDGRRLVITHVIDFEKVIAQDPKTGRHEPVSIAALSQPDQTPSDVPDVSLTDTADDDWDRATSRQRAIEPLLARDGRRTRADVAQAAKDYGVDPATFYRWIHIYEGSGCKTSSLLPRRRQVDVGQSRLPEAVEEILVTAIDEFYLTKKQPSAQATALQVQRLCREAGLPAPHPNTVRNRIAQLTERQRLRHRAHTKDSEDRFEARPGEFAAATHPLAVVQIDHTLLNVMLVDEEDRRCVGRPWLTLACDVYSRMIVGFYVSLDPPGASSIGLCLSHAFSPKETWLAKRGIGHNWPCWGLPAIIHSDNGRDFRGKMLQRACNEYGIEMNFRILAKPHYGAHIERMMGTLSTALETLDGSTFHSPAKRGDYDSEGQATMTLSEFECWLAEYITGVYHQRAHSTIKTSPIQRWHDGVFGSKTQPNPRGLPNRPSPEEEFRIRLDFMPYVERTVQQYGVQIDDIFYFSDVLRPYIGMKSRNGPRQYVFRRDPRDISVVYFFDPQLKQYAEIPYHNPTHPPISLWELRAIRKQLRDDGRKNVDEDAIFASYDRLHQQQTEAAAVTKRVRREKARRKSHKHLERLPSSPKPPPTEAISLPDKIEPFEIVDL